MYPPVTHCIHLWTELEAAAEISKSASDPVVDTSDHFGGKVSSSSSPRISIKIAFPPVLYSAFKAVLTDLIRGLMPPVAHYVSTCYLICQGGAAKKQKVETQKSTGSNGGVANSGNSALGALANYDGDSD